jgi:hypothetical protein
VVLGGTRILRAGAGRRYAGARSRSGLPARKATADHLAPTCSACHNLATTPRGQDLRTLPCLVHHEPADAAGIGRRLRFPYRRDDQHQPLVAVTVQVLAQVEVAQLPAAGVGRVTNDTLEDVGTELAGDVG